MVWRLLERMQLTNGKSSPIDQFEHFLQDREEDATALNLPRFIFRAFRKIEYLLHLLDQFIENIGVHDAKKDQERGTDAASDDSTDRAEFVEP